MSVKAKFSTVDSKCYFPKCEYSCEDSHFPTRELKTHIWETHMKEDKKYKRFGNKKSYNSLVKTDELEKEIVKFMKAKPSIYTEEGKKLRKHNSKMEGRVYEKRVNIDGKCYFGDCDYVQADLRYSHLKRHIWNDHLRHTDLYKKTYKDSKKVPLYSKNLEEFDEEIKKYLKIDENGGFVSSTTLNSKKTRNIVEDLKNTYQTTPKDKISVSSDKICYFKGCSKEGDPFQHNVDLKRHIWNIHLRSTNLYSKIVGKKGIEAPDYISELCEIIPFERAIAKYLKPTTVIHWDDDSSDSDDDDKKIKKNKKKRKRSNKEEEEEEEKEEEEKNKKNKKNE